MNKNMIYKQEHGFNKSEHPDQIKMHAISVVCRHVLKGGVLVIGYAVSRKTGNLALTVAIAVGNQYIHSPSLDTLAWGMGALCAARFLVEFSRMRCRQGSIAIEATADRWQDVPEATRGEWAEDYTQ